MKANIKQKVRLDFTHNKMELIPDNGCEIVHEDGKWFVIRKAEKYPKTLEECCNILGVKLPSSLKHSGQTIISYRIATLGCLQELLICRDAYWKIAGDWKPTSNIGLDDVDFSIRYHRPSDTIHKTLPDGGYTLLSFPTAEMRDIFYDNFKELIEQCKELL